MRKLFLFVFCLLQFAVWGQRSLSIEFVIEGSEQVNGPFHSMVQNEIEAVLSSRADLKFEKHFAGFHREKINEEVVKAMNSPSDVVITLGLMPSTALSFMGTYPKSAIAGIVINEEALNLKSTVDGTSGINNFTYIVSPFDIKKDLERFKTIYDYKKVGVVTGGGTLEGSSVIENYFKTILPEDEFKLVPSTGNVQSDIQKIPADVDALYILPLSEYSAEGVKDYFTAVNAKKLPTFSLMGKEYTQAGSLASQAPDNFLPTYARRIALDVLKLFEGENASDLPVYIEGLQNDFVINMATAEQIGLYPDFDIMNKATLMGLDEEFSTNKLTLESAIFTALKNNLTLQGAQKNISIADEDVTLAKANLFPQVSANGTVGLADQNTIGFEDEAFGNIALGGNLTQLIYSEPAWANLAVQKILKEQTLESTRQTQLDIILNASRAYLQYLQAKSILKIRSENVEATKRNLDISTSKAGLGYSAVSDVYRLESQLAQNNIDLNSALASTRQAKYNMNQLLNRPQDENFSTEDIGVQSGFSFLLNTDLESAINNMSSFNAMVDFMVNEAKENLPELKQLELAKQAQERLLKSNQRSIFLPQVALSADVGKTLKYFNLPNGLNLDNSITWTVGGQVSIPVFQGQSRRANIRRSAHSIDQIKLQKQDTENQLEQVLRTNVQNLVISYTSVELSQTALNAANKNFKIIQDLYQNGEADIITLIDAQNAQLQAEINATNTIYQLLIDVLGVERYTGQYYFLMDDNQKTEFINKISAYLLNK